MSDSFSITGPLYWCVRKFTYHLLGKLLSQALDLKLCEILSLFLKGFWHSRNLLFLLSDHSRQKKSSKGHNTSLPIQY